MSQIVVYCNLLSSLLTMPSFIWLLSIDCMFHYITHLLNTWHFIFYSVGFYFKTSHNTSSLLHSIHSHKSLGNNEHSMEYLMSASAYICKEILQMFVSMKQCYLPFWRFLDLSIFNRTFNVENSAIIKSYNNNLIFALTYIYQILHNVCSINTLEILK